MSQHVRIAHDDGIVVLTLDRPEKLNALTREMYTYLAEALEQAQRDDAVRAVLIRGSETCFSSGNDIKDFLQDPPSSQDTPVFRFMHAVLALGKPLVAAVTGPAVGIGTTLLLHCDLVYVSRDARLQVPFINLGLTPEFGASLILPRRLGQARAAELLLLGETLDGAKAAAWGLANDVLEDGAATLKKAEEAVARFRGLAPSAVTDSKRLMRNAERDVLLNVIDEEAKLFALRLRTPEAVEAFSAFMQRRKPDFNKLG